MATPKKPTTANQREDRVTAKPTAPTQTINLYGSPATNARPVNKTPVVETPTKKPVKTTPASAMGGVGRGEYGPTGTSTSTANTGKTIVSRIAKYDSKGKVIGYDLIYSDGSTGFEPNPSYGQ